MTTIQDFLNYIGESFNREQLVKITLSKPPKKTADLTNVYIRPIQIQGESMLSFTYRYKTNDQTQNFSLEDSLSEIGNYLVDTFRSCTVFNLEKDVILQKNKKGKISFREQPPTFSERLPESHDHVKVKRVETGLFLQLLGVVDQSGKVIPKMADKFRQINKYLEIIESLLKDVKLPKKIHVVDMGSGKGYLTFALYDFLVNKLGLDATVTGVEYRKDLVDSSNERAQKCEFLNLKFVEASIADFKQDKIDVLIALHACDTATDDAIYKGLQANASLIICAPCCHKQVRQSTKGVEFENPMLKYGIFKERQFEMITDTIRALILEDQGYQSKVFEFVSNEHTRKNVMLVGVKSNHKLPSGKLDEIQKVKEDFQVEEHYLERLLSRSNSSK